MNFTTIFNNIFTYINKNYNDINAKRAENPHHTINI